MRQDGGIAHNLRRALAERAQTARGALRDGAGGRMGLCAVRRAYTIADQSEAFMFQLARDATTWGARAG
ncbi:MAG: hypothetical protein ACLUI3_10605 [Christensenellales bacterium]